MLALASVFSSSLLLQPLAPSRPARSIARTPPLVTASILEKTRGGTLTEIQPGARYRTDDQPTKYYSGPNPANKAALQKMRKDIGKRKLVIITGASSGLGLFCFEALLGEVCIDSHTSARLADAAAVHSDARGICSSRGMCSSRGVRGVRGVRSVRGLRSVCAACAQRDSDAVPLCGRIAPSTPSRTGPSRMCARHPLRRHHLISSPTPRVAAPSCQDYYVIAAVRDPAKMEAAAKKVGVATTD